MSTYMLGNHNWHYFLRHKSLGRGEGHAAISNRSTLLLLLWFLWALRSTQQSGSKNIKVTFLCSLPHLHATLHVNRLDVSWIKVRLSTKCKFQHSICKQAELRRVASHTFSVSPENRGQKLVISVFCSLLATCTQSPPPTGRLCGRRKLPGEWEKEIHHSQELRNGLVVVVGVVAT